MRTPGGGNQEENTIGGKHLTLDDRIAVERDLLLGHSVRQIADLLHMSHTTVSRELLWRRQFQQGKDGASRPSVCLRLPDCPHHSRGTRACGPSCPDFAPRMPCERLNRASFVCNGCGCIGKCALPKMLYKAREAQDAYRARLVGSREGADLTREELCALEETLTQGLARGLSPYHLVTAFRGRVMVSLRTVYRYIDEGLLPSLRKVHLLRSAGMKPRKSGRREHKVDPHCHGGRAYEDFLKFREDNPCLAVAEMDTVLGTRGGAVPAHAASRRGRAAPNGVHTAAQQRAVRRRRAGRAGEAPGHGDIPQAPPRHPHRQRKRVHRPREAGGQRAQPRPRKDARLLLRAILFSWQKPLVESSNAYLRQIFPKGVEFTDVVQEAVSLVASHVNAKLREALNGRSAADVFVDVWGEETLELPGLRKIAPGDVNLTPAVLDEAVKGR